MQRSKLIDVLRKFETRDYRRLKELLCSPFFNKNEELVLLLQYIQKHCKNFDSKKLDRAIVYKNVFNGKPFDEKHLGYLQSDLLKMIEKFRVHEEIENSNFQNYAIAANFYHDQKIEKNFQQTLRKAKEFQEKSSFRDSQYYYNNYLMYEIANAHYEQQQSRKFDDSLQNSVDNLDNFYLINKLKASCEMLNRKNIISGEYEIKFMENILNYLADSQEQVPAIEIYYTIYKMLNSDDRSHFDHLNELLTKHSDLFPFKELRDMYAYAINYAIKKVNHGQTQFFEDLFELYKALLDKRIIFDSKYLSQFTYKNIVSIAIRLKEFEWAKEFMDNYKEELDPSLQENAYAYNTAKWYYSQKKYTEALRQSLIVEYNDVYYALDTKLIQLKIYFETDDVDPLLAMIESFKVYLKRNKLISKTAKEPYFRLIKYIHKATHLPYGKTEKLKKLLEEIKSDQNVVFMNWLIESLEERN